MVMMPQIQTTIIPDNSQDNDDDDEDGNNNTGTKRDE